jgi:hypothetical protein
MSVKIQYVLLVLVAVAVLGFIFRYESNKKRNRPRLTGRGGDFEH